MSNIYEEKVYNGNHSIINQEDRKDANDETGMHFGIYNAINHRYWIRKTFTLLFNQIMCVLL